MVPYFILVLSHCVHTKSMWIITATQNPLCFLTWAVKTPRIICYYFFLFFFLTVWLALFSSSNLLWIKNKSLVFYTPRKSLPYNSQGCGMLKHQLRAVINYKRLWRRSSYMKPHWKSQGRKELPLLREAGWVVESIAGVYSVEI